jgi:hypothetical protein
LELFTYYRTCRLVLETNIGMFINPGMPLIFALWSFRE